MTDKQTLAQSLRRYGSDSISHAASRGIADIEAAGELMLEAARVLAEQPEQEPVAWDDAQRICDLPAVDDAIRALIENQTNDNAVCVVQAILAEAPQPAIPPGWADAYAAFRGAFDTPLARRRNSGEHAQEARRLLRAFNDAMLAAPEAPQPAKPAEPVASAMSAVIAAMQADPEYAWSWHCNVAMAFVDAGGDHYTANQGAARFMRLLANAEPAHDLPEAPQPAKRAQLTDDEIDRAITELGLDYFANAALNRAVLRELCKRAHGGGQP